MLLAILTLAIAAVAGRSPAILTDEDWTLNVKATTSPAAADSAQPQLSSLGRRVILSWVERSGENATLRFAQRTDSGWTEARTVASGADWFVNWADVTLRRPPARCDRRALAPEERHQHLRLRRAHRTLEGRWTHMVDTGVAAPRRHENGARLRVAVSDARAGPRPRLARRTADEGRARTKRSAARGHEPQDRAVRAGRQPGVRNRIAESRVRMLPDGGGRHGGWSDRRLPQPHRRRDSRHLRVPTGGRRQMDRAARRSQRQLAHSRLPREWSGLERQGNATSPSPGSPGSATRVTSTRRFRPNAGERSARLSASTMPAPWGAWMWSCSPTDRRRSRGSSSPLNDPNFGFGASSPAGRDRRRWPCPRSRVAARVDIPAWLGEPTSSFLPGSTPARNLRCGQRSRSFRARVRSEPHRANRPTLSNQATANASPPPAMVTSAPIFISSRSGPRRHHRRRKEQGKDEADGGGTSDHHEFAPADALREVQPGGDRHAGGRDDAERASERGDRDRPHAGLEAVQRDAGIDEPEQEQHALDRKSPPALEQRQRIVSLRRRLDQQAAIAPPVRKEWHDRHQRERRMNAAQEQRHQDSAPGPSRYSQKFLTPPASQGGGQADGGGHQTRRPSAGCASPIGLEHGDTRQADRIGGNRQQQQERNGWMTPEDQPRDDVGAWNINRRGRHPPALEHMLTDDSGQTRDSIAIDTTTPPMAAATGSAARRHGWRSPPGRVASATSLVISAKKKTMPISLTEKARRMRESIVAVRERVGPHQRGGAADRQREQIVEDETGDATGHPPPSRQRRRRMADRRARDVWWPLIETRSFLLNARGRSGTRPAGRPGAESSRNRPSRRCGRSPGRTAGSRRFPPA